MKTTLITGGAGFIGSHLAERLIGRGDRVIIIDDLSTGSLENLAVLADHPHLEVVIDSVLNDNVLPPLAERADRIFHLAAAVGVKLIVSDPVKVIEHNVTCRGPTRFCGPVCSPPVPC